MSFGTLSPSLQRQRGAAPSQKDLFLLMGSLRNGGGGFPRLARNYGGHSPSVSPWGGWIFFFSERCLMKRSSMPPFRAMSQEACFAVLPSKSMSCPRFLADCAVRYSRVYRGFRVVPYRATRRRSTHDRLRRPRPPPDTPSPKPHAFAHPA